jgi:hypothetical protein
MSDGCGAAALRAPVEPAALRARRPSSGVGGGVMWVESTWREVEDDSYMQVPHVSGRRGDEMANLIWAGAARSFRLSNPHWHAELA